MRALRRFAAVLLCAFGLAYSGRAIAQSAAPIELKWNALEGCPSADSVLARVRKIAGTTRATGNTLRAAAAITQPSDGVFRLRLEIHYGGLAAVRNIEGKSCKDLAGAAAVALALLLSSEEPLSERDLAGTSPSTTGATVSGNSGTSNTSGSTGTSDTSGTSDGNQEPDNHATPQTPPPASPEATQPTTTTPSSAEWRVLLVAPLGALAVGPMPQLSRGLGGAVGFSFDRWQFLAEGKLWASQHETISSWGSESDLELNRFMSVHHLTVRGSGPNLASNTDTVTWAAVGLGAQGRWLITEWLALVGGLDAELQLSRPEISISLPVSGSLEPTGSQVERLGVAAATITVGPQWIF
jgi:hypothetical protein